MEKCPMYGFLALARHLGELAEKARFCQPPSGGYQRLLALRNSAVPTG